MYPMFMMPQPTNNPAPQRSMKEQLEDAEDLIEFFKKKYEKKDDKGPPKLKDKKFSLWETGLILAVVSFIFAVPIVTYQLQSLVALKMAMETVFK